MTTPDSFATSDDAAAYGYALADAAAPGLLARATQAIRDEAGIPVTQTTSTVELEAHCGQLMLPTSLVISVTSIDLIRDGESSAFTNYRWLGGQRIRIGQNGLPFRPRPDDRFAVIFMHGFAVIPASLVMLTAAVAFRLQATPVGAEAGLKSKTVGSVSWTAGEMPSASLTAAECSKLRGIVPIPVVWKVKI